jgi:hypothetical protein
MAGDRLAGVSVIEFGGSGSFLPAWSVAQWIGAAGVGLLVVLAGLVIYAVFFSMPGGIFFVPAGMEYEEYWRRIMDERAAIRGRITKRMLIYLGFALGMLGGAGAIIWLLF